MKRLFLGCTIHERTNVYEVSGLGISQIFARPDFSLKEVMEAIRVEIEGRN